ncbi:MAG: thiol reductase thioredoxin [Bacteroidetes bacterium]|jgi:thioredoxin|nr:thiol reductase thioredoxin [Bacteroidota bacterium]
MKNKIFVFALALVFITLSCGSKANKTNQQEASVTTEQESDKKSVKEGEPVYLDKQMFLDRVMNYEKNTDKWVYEGNKPALIDFYADWCAPCRITSPILDELAKEYAGKILIYKIDTDEQQELASVFGVRGLPSFLYIPMEGQPTMTSGIAQSPEETKQMFKDHIEKYLLSEL